MLVILNQRTVLEMSSLNIIHVTGLKGSCFVSVSIQYPDRPYLNLLLRDTDFKNVREIMLNDIEFTLPPFSYLNQSALFLNIFHIISRWKLLVNTRRKNLSTTVFYVLRKVLGKGQRLGEE